MNPFKLKYCPFWAACAVAALPGAAIAGDGPYVGVEGGVNYMRNQNENLQPPAEGVESLKMNPGWLAGLDFGYAFSSGLRPELEFDFRRNQIHKAVGDFAVGEVGANGFQNNITGMANLWYDVKTNRGFFSVVHPYIGGGVGVARYSIQRATFSGIGVDDYNIAFAYQGGAGVGFDITRNLTASVDWRYLGTVKKDFNAAGGGVTQDDAKYVSNALMGSLRYSFGAAPVYTAYVPPPPPPPAPMAPPPAPIGDSDGDGVPDNLDKCPGTPHGFKVDKDGCIIEQSLVLRGINFEFNSDQLTQPAMQTLDEVGAALVGQPSLAVQINGYTDSVGSAGYNRSLSDKRAASVRRYLVGKGVAPSNLVSKGYGKEDPIASNDTEEGRTENRRVEFVVLNKPSTVKVVSQGSTDASKAAAEVGDQPTPVHHRHHHHKMVPPTVPAAPQ